mgnify:CR=1 FL=1
MFHLTVVEMYQELEEAIQKLKKEIREKGKVKEWPSSYSIVLGSETLPDFHEYMVKYYNKNRPIWAEAFQQIYIWQFVALYKSEQGLIDYYDMFRENNSCNIIVAVSKYLKENGYCNIYKYYVAPIVTYHQQKSKYFEYPHSILQKTRDWIVTEEGQKIVWNFYVDVLEKNKLELLESEKEKL